MFHYSCSNMVDCMLSSAVVPNVLHPLPSPPPPSLPEAESYVGRGSITKHIRYHGRGRYGIERRRSAHYFLKLREGSPPPKKKRKKEDHKSFKTLKLINAGPRSIPNSL